MRWTPSQQPKHEAANMTADLQHPMARPARLARPAESFNRREFTLLAWGFPEPCETSLFLDGLCQVAIPTAAPWFPNWEDESLARTGLYGLVVPFIPLLA